MMDAWLPARVVRLHEWHRRFRRLGFDTIAAARAAVSRSKRAAYGQTKLEHLPDSIRGRLRVAVDVGANEGQWSTALLALVRPVRLELFEPNPACVRLLHARLRDIPGVRVHGVGLGAASGELTLNVTRSSDFASFLQPADRIRDEYAAGAVEIAERVTVPVETLDRALPDVEVIDLLKLDVQGFERHVIEGGRATLQRTRALLVEANFVSHYAGDDSLASLSALLQDRGMTLWGLAPPFLGRDGRPLWCDAVFVRPELI
jgi:FkbM family methyltransferase